MTIPELQWIIAGLLGVLLIVIGRIFLWFHCRVTDCEIRMRQAVTSTDMQTCADGIKTDVRAQGEHTLTKLKLMLSEHTHEITQAQRKELDAIHALTKGDIS